MLELIAGQVNKLQILIIILSALIMYLLINFMSVTYFEKDKITIKKSLFYSKVCFIISLFSAVAYIAGMFIQNGRINIYTAIKLYTIVTFMGFFTVTDLKEKKIPNRYLAILLVLWLAITAFYIITDFSNTLQRLGVSLLGLIFCCLTFGLTYLISNKRIGGGDVKLALLMGLYLDSERVVGAVLYGSILMMIFSVIGLFAKKVDRKTEIPFCPFLYIGTLISLFLYV